MKRGIERSPLNDGETYIQRIQTAVNAVTPENCQNYIRHMKSFWVGMLRRLDM